MPAARLAVQLRHDVGDHPADQRQLAGVVLSAAGSMRREQGTGGAAPTAPRAAAA